MTSKPMMLIATDEAGYGPKLGPLVIVATAWKIPAQAGDDLDALFAPLREPRVCDGASIVVDDSKAVYKPGDALKPLHAVFSASQHWCGHDATTLPELLPTLASEDLESIKHAPWLAKLSEVAFLNSSDIHDVLKEWRRTGIELLDAKARIITAEAFNATCDRGGNKADLLSESTIGLVRSVLAGQNESPSNIAVFCDRHGGRRYYGGVLQHVFPDSQLQVISEAKRQSSYRLTTGGCELEIHFTVKGDSFTPVALSSMHAKYLRERFMESFNAYFLDCHRETPPLRPTAGYPQDADRFLADIMPAVERQKIESSKLIRAR